jgi:mRNA-degrading endonuclease RelE of RelBE toxin-antitoxin system
VTDTPWRVEVKQRAKKDLARLDMPVRQRIVVAARKLAEDPHSGALRKLAARPESRLRVGDWRVLVTLDEDNRTVNVQRILPRGRAYDR